MPSCRANSFSQDLPNPAYFIPDHRRTNVKELIYHLLSYCCPIIAHIYFNLPYDAKQVMELFDRENLRSLLRPYYSLNIPLIPKLMACHISIRFITPWPIVDSSQYDKDGYDVVICLSVLMENRTMWQYPNLGSQLSHRQSHASLDHAMSAQNPHHAFFLLYYIIYIATLTKMHRHKCWLPVISFVASVCAILYCQFYFKMWKLCWSQC